MRWASSGVPVHLVPLSFQPHTSLSRLVLLSCLHSFVSCARAHWPSPQLHASPRRGVCVCVCVPLVVTGILLNCFVLFLAGGPWTLGWHGPTKTHPSCRENVPAWCTWAHCKTQLVAMNLILQMCTDRRHLVDPNSSIWRFPSLH